MVIPSRTWWRRLLIVGCLLASVLALWRISDVRAALQRDRLAAAAFDHGQQLLASGQRTEAAAVFRAAVAYVPTDLDLYELVALAQLRIGRIDDAVATYRQILRMYPYSYVGGLYRGVGLVELRGGRFRAAQEDLLRAIELEPGDWFAYHLLGHARKRAGDINGARAAWQRALDLNPDFQPAREQLRALDETP